MRRSAKLSTDARDRSHGYEAKAHEFIRRRAPDLGAPEVRGWARTLPQGGSVLDLGCGHGVPITRALVEEGLRVLAVDASPTLLAALRGHFPEVPAVLAAAEELPLRDQKFDGILAWGLVFLLPPARQRALFAGVAAALRPGGRLLFTSPAQECRWRDVLTGRESVSLGAEEYVRLAEFTGLRLEARGEDAGQNHYLHFRKAGTRTL